MRILVDLKSHLALPPNPEITQVEKDPSPGLSTPINGRYIIPVVPGAEFSISLTSYVLNGFGSVDGGDVASLSFAHLLAGMPMFGNCYFNPLLTADHVGELDLAATFKDVNVAPPWGPSPPFAPTFHPVRCQTGRAPLPGADSGQMPTHTALLPPNASTVGEPPSPGLIITDEIDIGPFTLDAFGNQVGTDEFVVYWKLFDFSVTHDVTSDFGATAGMDTPAIRSVIEVDQEPADFSAYISPDNGGNWCQVNLMEPIAFCNKTTKVRLAFRNDGAGGSIGAPGDRKIFIASFGLLF